jgi:hypothetical protein
MNANLMCAAGLEPTRNQGGPLEGFHGLYVRNRFAGTGRFAAVATSRRAA